MESDGHTSRLADVLKSGRLDDEFVCREDGSGATAETADGMCVECGDQPRVLLCIQCGDDFCGMCFESQHRRGKRATHDTRKLEGKARAEADGGREVDDGSEEAKMSDDSSSGGEPTTSSQADSSSVSLPVGRRHHIAFGSASHISREWMAERAKFIPLRLALRERKFMRLVDSMLDVSEYTDRVDIISSSSKRQRIVVQLKEVCAILTGLVVACDYKEGQKLLKSPTFKDNAVFFQRVFEIARRHKIRNPEKLRTSYGKLIHLLQDSACPEIKDLLEFSCVSPVETVHSFLEKCGKVSILTENVPLLLEATDAIESRGKTRSQVEREIRKKEIAFKRFCEEMASSHGLSFEDVEMLVHSIGDNHSFLQSNREPVDKMIEMLKGNFDPKNSKNSNHSLAICSGKGGARLSHRHETQYYYVLQSLSLWREILHDFFRLWYLAEQDLLSGESPYRLRNTAQGLQRVQNCPRIGRAIREILYRVQQKVGNHNWIGSSVVHLGDHNVPNSFIFIDKYTQVARILAPIVLTIERIPELMRTPSLARYVRDSFGDAEGLKMAILTDFFRYGFDGSGSDNFFDSGSCIDGRLTSAWNWCSKISKKPFYPVFLFTGFASFDGEW
eukprot:140458_1